MSKNNLIDFANFNTSVDALYLLAMYKFNMIDTHDLIDLQFGWITAGGLA